MKLRCATFNLKGIGFEWFEKRFDALITALKPLSPDVLCFQESTVRHEGSDLYNQAQAVGKAIGLPITVFAPYGNPVETMSRDQGGIAIISRWPVGTVRNRRLCPGHERTTDVRVATFATLLTPHGELDVVTSHLSWKPEETEVRLMQMGMILKEFAASQKARNGRCVLLGDFNATEEEPAIKLATEYLHDAFRMLHPSDPGFTWRNDNPLARIVQLPDRRIDYIFCPVEAQIRSCEVVFDKPSPVYPSDHFGVLAEIQWRRP